jgi:hypothetical protein
LPLKACRRIIEHKPHININRSSLQWFHDPSNKTHSIIRRTSATCDYALIAGEMNNHEGKIINVIKPIKVDE